MMDYLARQLQLVWQDERGIETLEWIAMAAVIIILVILAVYPGGLGPAINGVITNISTHI